MSATVENSQSQQTKVSAIEEQPTELVVKGDFTNSALTQHILDIAAKNKEFASRLSSDPSETFLAAGMTLSSIGGLRTEFNDYFRQQGEPVLAKIQEGHATNNIRSLKEIDAQLESFSVKCTACKVGVIGVAGAIVAVGVVGLASLAETVPVVASAAAFLGISTTEALSFLKTLAPKVESGVNSVAEALCQKLGAC